MNEEGKKRKTKGVKLELIKISIITTLIDAAEHHM